MLDAADIRELLPHGHPMLLVDRVLELTPGASIVGAKAITLGEQCYGTLNGAQPAERYAYPVSLLLESFGQTAALLWLHTRLREAAGEDRIVMLVAARDCRIERDALPGDVLRHVARIEHAAADTLLIAGETFVGDRRVASIGSMMAVMRSIASLTQSTSEGETR